MDVARGKSVRMSSQYGTNWPASAAVDGNMSTFCHTNEENQPWVEVDLFQSHRINRIRIVNRGDGQCEERLGGFNVLVDGRIVGSFQKTQLTGRPPAISVGVDMVGQHVRVQLHGRNYLHLTAIEVYGTPVAAAPVVVVQPSYQVQPQPVVHVHHLHRGMPKVVVVQQPAAYVAYPTTGTKVCIHCYQVSAVSVAFCGHCGNRF